MIADSEHARGDLVTRFGLPPDRVRVVPLGVAERFRTPPPAAEVDALRARVGLGDVVVACVGTVQPRKHVERVIDAFGRADGVGRGWQLVVAGRLRPGYVPAWTTAPPPGVRWLGPLDDASLRSLYATAAVVVSVSEYEGFGLTVVAVATSSIPEVVGDAGVLVPRSEADLLAEALVRVLETPGLRADLGRRGRERAARFTWDESARRTRAVYDEVLRS